MKKKGCLTLAILLVLLSLSGAYAAEPLSVHLEGYEAANNSITVYFNSNSNQDLSLTQLSLSAGGHNLKLRSLQHFSQANAGITYLFLADVSGSMDEQKLSCMKDIMNSVADTMTERDSASVGTIGNDVSINPFVSGGEETRKQINAIAETPDDTDLYAAIVKALDALNTNSLAKTKKCLIILSDGDDDYAEGITREEVEKKIEQSHLPVYTVAMMDTGAGKQLIESSKVFGSFARQSAGGIDLAYNMEDKSPDAVTGSITESVAKGYILTADISNLTAVNDQSYLELKINAESQGTDSDGYMIDGSKIRSQIVPTASQSAPSVSPSPEATQTWMEMTVLTIPMPYVLIIAAAIIAAVIVLIVLLRRRRKKIKKASLIEKTMAADVEIDLLKAPVIELRFTKIGQTDGQIFTHRMKDELVIGRDPAKAKMVFAQDELLSGQHCTIFRKEGKLLIKDLNSTNGTYLNGIPVRENHTLEQDDIILIGSMELRINWDKK